MFGSVAPAIAWREARCVRSGPTQPAAVVPRIVWQYAHDADRKISWPRFALAVGGGFAGFAASAIHFSHSRCGRARTRKCMRACCRPQNSAHTPR